MNAPWTDLGRVESDIRDVKSQLSSFAKSYEFHEISRRVDTLECSVREIGTSLDGFRYEIEELLQKINDIELRGGKDE